jgi:hypothetical protein
MSGNCDPPKEYRFSSTNQPDPQKKRVPKYKTRLKKYIIDNIEVVNEKLRDGNPAFWNMAFERAYGKEVEKIEQTSKVLNIDYSQLTEDEAKKLYEELHQ